MGVDLVEKPDVCVQGHGVGFAGRDVGGESVEVSLSITGVGAGPCRLHSGRIGSTHWLGLLAHAHKASAHNGRTCHTANFHFTVCSYGSCGGVKAGLSLGAIGASGFRVGEFDCGSLTGLSVTDRVPQMRVIDDGRYDQPEGQQRPQQRAQDEGGGRRHTNVFAACKSAIFRPPEY